MELGPMTERKFRKDIESIRGIAIICVLLYHMGVPFFENGFIGVDIFFIVSGFLMAKIYQIGKTKNFLIRRTKRIGPSYLLAILLTFLFSALLVTPSDFAQVRSQTFFSILMVPNGYFWSRNSYFDATDFNPLLHLWSLGLEIQFYLLVPIVAWAFLRFRTLFYLTMLTSLGICLLAIQISPKTAFFLLPFRLWEFMFGFLIANRESQLNVIFRRSRVSISAIALLVLILLIVVYPLDGKSTSILWSHPAIGSFIVSLLIGILLITRSSILENRIIHLPLGFIGRVSFSLYLVHFPVLVLVNYSPLTGTISEPKTAGAFFLSTSLIVTLTLLNFRLVESKDYFISRTSGRRHIAFASLFIVALSLNVTSQLNEWQATATEKRVAEAIKAREPYRCGKIQRILKPFSKTCQLYSSKSKTSVLLLGNSHADSLKPTFIRVARELDFSLFFWVRNDPLMSGGGSVESVIQEIDTRKIDHVILHFSNLALSNQQWVKVLETLKANRISVSIIGPVPYWQESIPLTVLKGRVPGNLTKRSFRATNRQIEFIESLSKSYGFSFFDTTKVLCKPNCAYSNSQGDLLYFDSNHLNVFGADFLYGFVRDKLVSELL